MIPLIVIIEDDRDLAQHLQTLLIENNFSVKTAATGVSGLAIVEKSSPNLVVLDWTLPDMDGESVCKQIKTDHPEVPIIMLTAKTAVADKVRGLSAGADDYITKPFITEELLARIKARLRGTTTDKPTIEIGDLVMNLKNFEVKRGEKIVKLTPQEFKLLEYLMQNAGVVLTREMILNRIWLYSPDIESRVVDVYMGYLRKKIDAGAKVKLLQSIRGFGYTIKG